MFSLDLALELVDPDQAAVVGLDGVVLGLRDVGAGGRAGSGTA
jgi:hypothetical protein